MLGHQAKRGVVTALERVFAASGGRLGWFEVLWTGKTAGVVVKGSGKYVNIKLIMPAIDELAQVSKSLFNNLIGYDLHELGHVWFTDTEVWDVARQKHGQYLSNLINGLEDPRIERKVIESGYAPNSRILFETLTNSVLDRDGYIEPDDRANIPFLLAIEGRRLNGYQINVPCIVDQSPWAVPLRHALTRASSSQNTQEIVDIAIELLEALKDSDEQPEQQDGQPEDQPEDGDQDGGQGEDGEGEDGEGQDTPQDGSGEPESGDQGESEGKGTPDPNGDPTGGDGWSDLKGRSVEPNDFIESELEQHKCEADHYADRPAVLKPKTSTFSFF